LNTDTLIDRLQEILREVGATLLDMRARGAVQGTWHATQLKSDADLVAEQFILDALNRLSPALPAVSEEDLTSHGVDRRIRYWLVDPIDGTASYCGGYAGFVTQVALMEGAQPVLAAVYAPAMERMYLAERGCGARVNGDCLALGPVREGVVLTDNYPQPRGIAKLLVEKLPCVGYIVSGSIGLKICRVADGSADLFVKDVAVRDWDLAPGDLVLREAGGVLTDLEGRPIEYSSGMEQTGGLVAAASAGLARRVADFLAREKMDV
jgi:3'-phosphoadenosine 5'-phosphosulfate (PAPS) 3'-phosphatase